MQVRLDDVVIAVLGGDDRELILIPELCKLGAVIRTAGIPVLTGMEGVSCFDTVKEAVAGARFVILPMFGVDEQGLIKAKYARKTLIVNREVMSLFPPDAIIMVGVARPLLKELAAQQGLKLIEMLKRDDVTILNAIPSAEGAIQMAMEAVPITIHGSNCFVFGFGRTGMTLARMLKGIGARTYVTARKPADLARISEMGLIPLTYTELPAVIHKADIIFNTVPAIILNEDLLKLANPGVYINDLASAPGGTDFAAAAELGIKAVLAPGLPGIVAPKTAGMILARVVPSIIGEQMALTSSTNPEVNRF
ncbi:dipicolinate synthase subunit DpsA [bacterium]|nr:MAG: dipicolinate synthase subunit DpsA [bacterium]